jgi:hypothetical protein
MVLACIAALSLAYWVAVTYASVRLIRDVPVLADQHPPEPAAWPRVSVIIAACNEEESIEGALRSRLAEGYPDAEYIVVDDRSTDRTGEIIDRLAAEDPRVVPVHVRELPEGWLGKVHAMSRGLQSATGDYILFSDADIHHAPGTLRRAIAYCQDRGVDHLVVVPEVWSTAFGLDVFMNAMLRMLIIISRPWKASDPTSRVSLGGGNFNLVRRESLDRAGGLDSLRLEVVDDAALGQIVKWSGARQAVVNARGLVQLYYYRSIPEAVRGMEKNAFAAMGRFSVARFLANITMLSVLESGCLVALAFGGGTVRALAALGVALAVGTSLAVARWMRRPLLASLLGPLGVALMVFGATRSMVLTLVRGGIIWRGTHYPLAALRRGMRLVLA